MAVQFDVPLMLLLCCVCQYRYAVTTLLNIKFDEAMLGGAETNWCVHWKTCCNEKEENGNKINGIFKSPKNNQCMDNKNANRNKIKLLRNKCHKQWL